MMNRTAAEIWQGFVGSQTPDEFARLSRDRGYNTIEDAVAAYVADIPDMFAQDYSAEELEEIADGLTTYLSAHGHH